MRILQLIAVEIAEKTQGNAHSPAHRHGNRRKDRKPASGGSNHDAATKKQKHSCQQSVSTRGNGPSAYNEPHVNYEMFRYGVKTMLFFF